MAVPAVPGLVQIRDRAGRPRGTGFLADDQGTLLTSHEVVDGLDRLSLRTPDGRATLAEEDDITPLPGCDLALVRTAGLPVRPLVAATERLPGTRVGLWTADGWLHTALGPTVDVTYRASDRFHTLEGALELDLTGDLRDRFLLSPHAPGTPVLDAETGAVVGVLGTALHGPRRACGYAVPLRIPSDALDAYEYERLEALLSRNGQSVPGHGPDLNLAGALQLTHTSIAAAATALPVVGRLTERADTQAAFADFLSADSALLALVGEPGTGRSTALVDWAVRRVNGAGPSPTLWLRGADLQAGDTGVHDAARRVLTEAGRIVGRLARPDPSDALPGVGGGASAWPPPAHPDVVARLARTARRPLLVMLDGPEEMPAHLALQLRRWCQGTANWLRVSGARLVMACRPEFWEEAGPHFPADLLHTPTRRSRPQSAFGLPLAPHLPLAQLPGGQHPLTERMWEQLQPVHPPSSPPRRHEIFEAWLALVSLRVATTLSVTGRPPAQGRALRRLAAAASGRIHLAAMRCLGAGQGALSRAEFETVFPWNGGWAAAVLSIGVFQPAGPGYRFSDEEFGDWLQGGHLELDAALEGLVHHPRQDAVPVPRHRVGPVVEALLLAHHTGGPARLSPRLRELVGLAHKPGDRGWWAGRLLRQTLTRLPDAAPYLPVLRSLAARLLSGSGHPTFGPSFWGELSLAAPQRLDLLRQLLPLDGLPQEPGERYVDEVARLLAAEPRTVMPLLCRWFSDGRPLRAPGATVASAAGALLHTYRGQAIDELADALLAALATVGGASARELLEELVEDEPAALSRAVHRWARDERRTAAAAHLRTLATLAGAVRAELRAAARELLRHPDELGTLHPAAYALLVHDPETRASYLSAAQLRFDRDPYDEDLARALVGALATHPQQVLATLRHRLCGPHPASSAVSSHLLKLFSEVDAPTAAREVSDVVAELAELRPELAAAPLAGYVRHRVASDRSALTCLRPLVRRLLALPSRAPRRALIQALAGAVDDSALARELLREVLAVERDAAVLDVARAAVQRHPTLSRPYSPGEGPAPHADIVPRAAAPLALDKR